MNVVTKHIIRFILLWLLQVLIFNQLEFGFGIHMMVYPLFIMLLPFDIGILSLLLYAFLLGLSIDIFSNTFGLHASSLLMMAFFRPIIFNFFAPRDGYDPLKQASIDDMGLRWFILTYGNLLLIHHFWFFLIEIFRMNEFLLILQNTFFSVIISFILAVVLQTLMIKKVIPK
jgi:hypothetical protein